RAVSQHNKTRISRSACGMALGGHTHPRPRRRDQCGVAFRRALWGLRDVPALSSAPAVSGSSSSRCDGDALVSWRGEAHRCRESVEGSQTLYQRVHMVIVNILAVLLSPLIAVLITVSLQNRKERRDSKRRIFETLIGTRHAPITEETTRALNMIDVVFCDAPRV